MDEQVGVMLSKKVRITGRTTSSEMTRCSNIGVRVVKGVNNQG